MMTIKGKYAEAKIFIDHTEPGLIEQVQRVLDNLISDGQKIRIMPDCHVGSGICIGFTTIITDKVVPYFVGSDIGCGMLVQKLEDKDIDLEKLDNIIHKNVPSGFSLHNKPHRWANDTRISELRCKDKLPNINKFPLAVGTLGSGNHFIELNKDDEGNYYLVIHTGSRNLGKQVADYYQNEAYMQMKSKVNNISEIIAQLQHLGREQEIESTLKSLPKVEIDKNLAYCEGKLMEDYLYDMRIAQEYARLNRKAIADTIQCGMKWNILEEFETVHNYIDLDAMILRKGAVSAKKGEILIVPMNMAWGSVIAIGKGNPDWNESCAHGSGRKMSRKKAKESVSMDAYRNSMNGIYTTCVDKSTIDESPMAYKNPEEVLENLKDTIEVVNRIVPVYNFKASGD